MVKKSTIRSIRKPRHGWFDYEVLDSFGDQLGPFGIACYVVLARWCYGGASVCMSLREMSRHGRMGKDKMSEALQTMVNLGLISEEKGRTPRSPSTYWLLDVKDLLEEMKAKGQVEPPVFVADSSASHRAGRQQQRLVIDGSSKAREDVSDATAGLLFTGSDAQASEGHQPSSKGSVDCLPQRQRSSDGSEAGAVCPDGQNCLPGSTELSATSDALNKKEERKNKTTPPTPPGGCELDPFDVSRWNQLHMRLKERFCSTPAAVSGAKRFTTVKPGLDDYEGCFRDWWLIGVRRNAAGTLLMTGATDVSATKAGLAKYRTWLALEGRKIFGVELGTYIDYVVSGPAAGGSHS